MKYQLRRSLFLFLGLIVAPTQDARALVISTFGPGGADAEVREAAPTTPRGTDDGSGFEHFDLGMRENSNHNGHVYLKFGVQGVSAANLDRPITIRTHWSLNNIANDRIEDVIDQVNATFADRPNVMFEYYVLDPNHAKNNWNEATIIYGPGPQGAPGVAYDGNFATDDLLIGPGQLTLLGTNELRSLVRNAVQPIENRIPIGEAFDLTLAPGSALHTAIVVAQATTHKTVTIVTTLAHDFDDVGVTPSWNNFNYVFMPKEKASVGVGVPPNFPDKDGYDNDMTDMIDWDPVTPGIQPPNSPHQGQPNTQANPFAPQLLMVDSLELPGDYNDNDVVDAADYTVWRDHLGQSFILTNQNPAATTPGVVDAEDYAFWKSRFGDSVGSGSGANANATVPEPTTWVLLMSAATGWFVRRSRAA